MAAAASTHNSDHGDDEEDSTESAVALAKRVTNRLRIEAERRQSERLIAQTPVTPRPADPPPSA